MFTKISIAQSLNVNIDELITKTDQIKTSNRKLFKDNLRILNKLYENASGQQQDYIDYLRVYRIVLEGDLDAAQQAYTELIEQVSSIKVKVITTATLANIQAVSRQYDKALLNLDHAITQLDQIRAPELTNRIHLVSAMIYSLLELYEMSIKYSDLIIQSNPSEIMICKASSIKLRANIKLGNIPSIDQLHETIGICNQVEVFPHANILMLDWIHEEIIKAQENNNTKHRAMLLSMLKKSADDIDKIGYQNLISLKDMVLAKAYYLNDDVSSALKSANKCIDGSKKSGKTYQLVECLNVLLNEAEDRNDFEKALQLSKRINEVENEIFSETKAKQMAYMSVKHNSLAKEFEIERLNKNNELLLLENKLAAETSARQKLLVVLISFLLFLLGFTTYRIKKRQDHFKKISEIDHLTQVFSRKAFEERMHDLIDDCESHNQPINLAILDLDHFKKINDQYGHQVGDWVLKQVVVACESVIDEDVLMARLGGEEFAIVTPATSFTKTSELLEQMRLAIEHLDCSETGYDIKLTGSFGVTSSLYSGYKFTALMADADEALFVAKNNGRNQVRAFESQEKSV